MKLDKILMALAALATAALPGAAQMRDNTQKEMTCDNHGFHMDRLETHCEIQEQTLAPSRGVMQVNPGMNGGVSIKGWSRSDILLRAKIETAAPSQSEARSMVASLRVASGAAQIVADGPAGDSDHHWSISYEIFVPHQTDFQVKTHNGGVHVSDIKGKIEFEALNGGAHLARLAGDVQGHTTNGGLHIELGGDRWDGTGMNVETTNGGVKLIVPSSYSAHVESSTVNGGMDVDFPITMHGRIGHELNFDMGSGGPTIRAITTNGGVKIQKS